MSADDVIAGLNEAKAKLEKAKATGLVTASAVANACDAARWAFKDQGRSSSLVAAIDAKKDALRAMSMKIDELVSGVEEAIAQVEEIGEGSSAGDGSGPS